MTPEVELAQKHYEWVVKSTEDDTNNVWRGHAFNNLGLLFDNTGDFGKSIKYYRKGQSIYARGR